MTPKISFQGVSRAFDVAGRGRFLALDRLTLDIADGEFVTVVGPSGCGKSTAMNIAAGLEKPTSGRILVDNAAVDGPGPERGIIFQQYALFPWLTVRENVEFGLRIAGKSRKERIAIADHFMDLVGLRDFADALPKTLSGGMKQRCAIARAYAVNPKILLMDEPFGALDALTRVQLQDKLLEAWSHERRTVMFITHDVDEAVYLANRVVVMATRPGRLHRVIPVGLPYPRTEEIRLSPEFTAIRNEVWRSVYHPAPHGGARAMLTRRLMLGSAMGSLAAPAIVHAATDTIRLGYIADYQNVSLPAIAADQKMWQAEGLVPDVKVFTNGPIQIQAMGAGSLDFGAIGPGALWLPASGRTKVVAVNLLTFSDRVIGQPDITSIAGLKGKKVGVPQGTSGEMILRLALNKAAMTVDDIQVIPMDPSTIVAAFSSKQIDGAGLWYPLVEVIKRRVPGLHELANDEEFYPGTSFINTFVARNDTLQSNPDLVRRFLRVLKRAMDWRVTNFDRSVELSADFLGIPVEAVRAVAITTKLLTSADLIKLTNDGTVDGWFNSFNELFKSFGTVASPLPPSQYYEGKLFVSA